MSKTVLFQTIQLSISTQFIYQTVPFDSLIEPYKVLPLRARVDLGAMAMNGYSAFTKHYRNLSIRLFSVISRTHILPLCRDAVGVFYSPSRLGKCTGWVYEYNVYGVLYFQLMLLRMFCLQFIKNLNFSKQFIYEMNFFREIFIHKNFIG